MSEVTIAVEQRNEFGKGAARRTRRAGQIPAVLYGHGSDPKHLSLPSVEFARAIRENGNNAVLTLEVAGSGKELALTKTITAHPIKGYIEHVDLLLVKRGEKVVVNIPVVVSGDAVSGSMVSQELTEVEVETEALHIPEQVDLSIEGAEIGTRFFASELKLPRGVTLQSDPETLVVNISEVSASMEEDSASEGGEAADEGDEASEEA